MHHTKVEIKFGMDQLHRVVVIFSTNLIVMGSWHWILVQGTQRQEGPK